MRKSQRPGFHYKKWCVMTVVCMITAVLCGCGGKYPKLSDEQEEAVVKYAAALLYENDQNRASRLMTEEEMILAMQRRAAHAYVAPTPVPEPEDGNDKEHSDGQGTANPSDHEPVVETRTLAEFFGFSGIDISYQGYFLTRSYPEESDDELYFAMDALEGNELLLLQYTITNLRTETAQVDILDLKPRFRLFINDGGQINAMSTLLLDDMKTTNCTLQPGESCNVVVVFEVTEEEAASIQELRLTVKTEEDSWTTELLESGTWLGGSPDSAGEEEQQGIDIGHRTGDNIAGISDKDIAEVDSTQYDSVRNDVTGKWKCLVVAENNFDVTEYALSCYENYFDSDETILAVINLETKTSTNICMLAGNLYVSEYEYVDGEEHDAEIMFSGAHLMDSIVYIDNGDIERVTE